MLVIGAPALKPFWAPPAIRANHLWLGKQPDALPRCASSSAKPRRFSVMSGWARSWERPNKPKIPQNDTMKWETNLRKCFKPIQTINHNAHQLLIISHQLLQPFWGSHPVSQQFLQDCPHLSPNKSKKCCHWLCTNSAWSLQPRAWHLLLHPLPASSLKCFRWSNHLWRRSIWSVALLSGRDVHIESLGHWGFWHLGRRRLLSLRHQQNLATVISHSLAIAGQHPTIPTQISPNIPLVSNSLHTRSKHEHIHQGFWHFLTTPVCWDHRVIEDQYPTIIHKSYINHAEIHLIWLPWPEISEIPAVPEAALKELRLLCVLDDRLRFERASKFHRSFNPKLPKLPKLPKVPEFKVWKVWTERLPHAAAVALCSPRLSSSCKSSTWKMPADACWCLLMPADACWCLLMPADACCHRIVTSSYGSDSIHRLLPQHPGAKMSKMRSNCREWHWTTLENIWKLGLSSHAVPRRVETVEHSKPWAVMSQSVC